MTNCLLKKQKVLLSLFLVFALLLGSTKISLGADTLSEVHSLLQTSYVDPVSDDVLNAQSIDETLKNLGDPFTMYFTAEQYQDFINSIDNRFTGIGIYIDTVPEGIKVLSVISGSPAEAAGLKAGDVITQADGKSLAGLSSDIAVTLMRGVVGSRVNLTVERDGDSVNFIVTRQTIEQPTVTGEVMAGQIGYIAINSFGSNTADLFGKTVQDLEAKNVTSWIVDLRDDPGGYLDTAINLAGYFIGANTVVQVKDRNDPVQLYTAIDHGFVLNQPVIVLINRNSASASEILSAAIKDNQKAILLGTNTYGKGTVQSMFDLSDGSVLKMTIARFYSPKGNAINKVGVQPNIALDDAAQAETAAELMLENIGRAIPVNKSGYMQVGYGNSLFSVSLADAQSPELWQGWDALISSAAKADSSISINKGGPQGWEQVSNSDLISRWPLYYPGYTGMPELQDIPLDKQFTVCFNTSVDWQTVNEDSIELIDSSSGERIKVGFQPLYVNTLKVVPQTKLKAGETYWLVIHPGIKGQSGGSLKSGVVTVAKTVIAN